MTPRALFRKLARQLGSSTAKTLIAAMYGDFARFVAQERVTSEQASAIRRSVLRLLRGEPVQYVVGRCEFMSLPFQVTPDVLIPRSDTETLVEIVLERSSSEDVYFDMGTGSGAIAVALSYYGKMRGYAVDISSAALDIARKNAQINGVSEKIRFIQGDSLAPLRDLSIRQEVSIIVSNPPYVPTHMLKSLPPEVQREPRIALDGGPDGLVHYRRIFQEFRELIRGKRIYMEFAPYEAESLEKIIRNAGMGDYTFFEGLDGIVRYVEVRA